MKIAILSFDEDKNIRGAEIWAKTLQEKLKEKYEINISHSFYKWVPVDVNIPINGRWQVLICRILTWLFRKPMVVFGHSGPGADDKWNLLCSPNVFVAFSNPQKEWAEKYKLPWTKVVMVPHAVDFQKFTPAKVKPNKNIILFVGANTLSKRINLVKNAVDLIPNANFMVVGKGNEIETTFDKIQEVYKKADVFCFVPHPWEAFGLVFLEALATNLPVVTTNDPIRREIVGDAGIFVDHPEDPKELADAIKKALEIDWKDRPRKQAENFSWDKIIIKYEELFKNLTK
ncbi:MAG: glycosyltransferase family 4 protein [Patescibacteria group bacterium]